MTKNIVTNVGFAYNEQMLDVPLLSVVVCYSRVKSCFNGVE